MSAMIDTMMYIGETPWHGLGKCYDTPLDTSEEIIEAAELNWTVNALPIHTDRHSTVKSYHAVYREDNDRVFGLVNNPYPDLVQNTEMFNSLSKLMKSKDISIETAAALGDGQNVFGCFKISDQFKLLDDQIDHYLVVFNDHLKADGKITIMNTPIRVVCQNSLNQALSNNLLKYRIVCTSDTMLADSLADHIMKATLRSEKQLENRAKEMLKNKIDKHGLERLLDELFPYIQAEGGSSHDKANERTEMMRNIFIEKCLGADNLINYRGTHYQVFNALTDFSQHYYTKPENGLDLNKRMSLLPGMGVDSPASKVSKFLKMSNKFIA